MGPLGRAATLLGFIAIGIALLGGNELEGKVSSNVRTRACKLIHLLCVSWSVGIGIWQSFFLGLVAYKTLPKQTFGLLQSKLFPLYFLVLTITTSISLIMFAILMTGKDHVKEQRQVYILIACIISCALNLTAFEPLTSSVMMQRHKLEREPPKESSTNVKDTKEYKALSRKFGMYHGLSSTSNLVFLVCIHLHAWHMSGGMDY